MLIVSNSLALEQTVWPRKEMRFPLLANDAGTYPGELDSQCTGLVRDHLEQVLASAPFAGSKRSQDFLRLIVEHALAGRFDSLRERMIGAEMFGRPIGYDTANDAVVRVKATDVRKRLAHYYREVSPAPPVRIELLAGSYEPKFHRQPSQNVFPLDEADLGLEGIAPATGLGEETQPFPELEAEPERRHKLGWIHRFGTSRTLFGLSAGLVLIAAIGYLGFQWWLRAANAPLQIRSIAILPIQNQSGDPAQDYLADGMTGQLIANLGQIAALRVISRTSSMTYKNTHKTIPEIARELGVDAVVEGTMSREGHRVRITADLVDARNDGHLWCQTYDRDLTSVLALQSEVARGIADRIKIEVSPRVQARLARANTISLDAQELYLRGIYILNGGDAQRALTLLLKEL
jgi:TolB-like protein